MSEMGQQTRKNSVRAYVFRFALKLGHRSTHSACLKGAMNGSRLASFNDTVGELLELKGHVDAKCFCGLHVDPQFDLRRLFHWQVGRTGSVQNSLHVIAHPDEELPSRGW